MTQRSAMTDESSGVALALRPHVPAQRSAPLVDHDDELGYPAPSRLEVESLESSWILYPSDNDRPARATSTPSRKRGAHRGSSAPRTRGAHGHGYSAAPTRGRGAHRRRGPRPLRRTASWVGNLVVLVTIAAFFGLAVGPHTGAYRTTTMLTGSMRPLYPPGSVLVITPQPASEVAAGQVLTFNAPTEDRRVVTHRVVSVDHSGPKPTMVTKGDANNGNDPWTATISGDTVWRVQGAVPFVGRAIQELRRPSVQLVLTRGLPALLLLSLLVSIWRPARKSDGAHD